MMESRGGSRSGDGERGGGRSFGGGGRKGRDKDKDKKRRDRRGDGLRFRKKTCRFCEEKLLALDYKDLRRMERLVSERGKILSRRVTGMCSKHQRMVAEAVQRARFMALLPYVKK
jgi:small subunit ribosomal protein S18